MKYILVVILVTVLSFFTGKCRNYMETEPGEIEPSKIENKYESYVQRMTSNDPYYFAPIPLDSVLIFFDQIEVEKNGSYLMILNDGVITKCCLISIVGEDTIARFQLKPRQITKMPFRYFKEDYCNSEECRLFLPKVYYQTGEN